MPASTPSSSHRAESELTVTPEAHGFGARVEGINLTRALTPSQVATLRQLWLTHKIISFPNQPLTHPQFEKFTSYFGDFGKDPFVAHLDEHPNILEVRREPAEQVAPFGSSWHSDWSFLATPPSATLLHAKIVPPIGGHTKFADGARAYSALDSSLQAELSEMQAIHSARRPYSPQGFENSGGRQRSMTITPSDDAWQTQHHPLIRTHAETGQKVLWINPVYTIGIVDLPQAKANTLLSRLFEHALKSEFIYTHRWQANMLTMWDNRSVQHAAQGGYDGYLRVMHRTTVQGEAPR